MERTPFRPPSPPPPPPPPTMQESAPSAWAPTASVNESAVNESSVNESSASVKEEEFITLKAVGQDGVTSMLFKLRKSTMMIKMKKTYCERAGIDPKSVRFSFDGQRIEDADTPATLEMEQDDVIDVFSEQVGGGRSIRSRQKLCRAVVVAADDDKDEGAADAEPIHEQEEGFQRQQKLQGTPAMPSKQAGSAQAAAPLKDDHFVKIKVLHPDGCQHLKEKTFLWPRSDPLTGLKATYVKLTGLPSSAIAFTRKYGEDEDLIPEHLSAQALKLDHSGVVFARLDANRRWSCAICRARECFRLTVVGISPSEDNVFLLAEATGDDADGMMVGGHPLDKVRLRVGASVQMRRLGARFAKMVGISPARRLLFQHLEGIIGETRTAEELDLDEGDVIRVFRM